MKTYKVEFAWYDTGTWCSNIVMAEDENAVNEHYKKYGEKRYVREAKSWEVNEAKCKGMPIVSLND